MTKSKSLGAATAALAVIVAVGALLHLLGSNAPAPATPTPTTTAPVVLHLSGTGSTTTPALTTGSDWSIEYTFTCADASGFRVLEWGPGEDGVPLVDRSGSEGIGATYAFAEPGNHWLQINTACSWTVTVTNGDTMPHAGQVTPTGWGAA